MLAGEVRTLSPIMAISAIAAGSQAERSRAMRARRSRRPLQIVISRRAEAILACLPSEGMLGRRRGLTSTSTSTAACSVATLALGEGPLLATCGARRGPGRGVRHAFGLAARTGSCKTARVARPYHPKIGGETGKKPSQMGRISVTFRPLLAPKGEVVRAAGRGMPA